MERTIMNSEGFPGLQEEPGSKRRGSKIFIVRPESMRLSLTKQCKMASSEGAGVYLAGVIEYLIAEILDTAVTHSDSPPGKLETGHVLDILHRDAELKLVFPPFGEAPYRCQSDRQGKNEASYYDVVKDAAKSVSLQTKRAFSFTQGNLG